MFEAKLAKCAVLKKILAAVKDLVTDGNWEVTSSGITFQTMDSAHTAFVSLHLFGDAFSKFRCDRSIVLGINLDNLAKILKCAGNDDQVTLKAGYDDQDKIKLVFEDANECNVSEYDIKLLTIDSENLDIVDTDYNVIIKLPSAKFQRICRDLSHIGDKVVIAVTKSEVQFSAKGDQSSGSICLSPISNTDKPEETVQISMNKAITQTFTLKYLLQFAKATPLCGQVTLSLSSDGPFVAEYAVLNELAARIGRIRFFLASKIDDD